MDSSILVGPPSNPAPPSAPAVDTAEAPPKGLNENGSATYLASGNPYVDFFFHVVPDTPLDSIEDRLRKAWSHNALTALKLVCHLRGVRGTGKMDKEGFYTAAFWLHGFHLKTLACNIASIADFGYFKDLPEILYRLLEGSEIRETQRKEWIAKKETKTKRYRSRSRSGKRKSKSSGRSKKRRSSRSYGRFKVKKARTGLSIEESKRRSSVPKEVRILNEAERARSEKEKASAAKNEKKIAMAKKLIARYSRDRDFKFLYDRISDHFADRLRSDLDLLRSGETRKISLAAKWCPSLDSSFDRSTLLCESIARNIFTRELFPEYTDLEEAHYAYRIRDWLRKEVLVPLRKVLELPEVYIGQNDWSSIPYNRVASVAMKLHKEKFMKHDRERFGEYLEKVKSGKATIAAGALLPNEIIAAALSGGADSGAVADLQWRRTVDDMKRLGKLRNSIAVCDVSGSIDGTPLDVPVALGLLLSELSDDPWKGKVITFSESPKLHLVSGDDLCSKAESIESMDWGGNTDFQKVFHLILSVAVSGNLSPEHMIKRVFVFSDMEFDEASPYAWETDYERICRRFERKGYGSSVPEIVFGNLRESGSNPVPASQCGVALVSGFSKNMMKVFLENDGAIDPVTVMEAAISGPEYQNLAVVD